MCTNIPTIISLVVIIVMKLTQIVLRSLANSSIQLLLALLYIGTIQLFINYFPLSLPLSLSLFLLLNLYCTHLNTVIMKSICAHLYFLINVHIKFHHYN